ncbi:DUF4339 domain-containing protein [Acaryochloris marina NIES-2412]|uniref:DUF4339 domain-containing protein n=1 Tax=Acaryochloris marina TaxID=155978 RepID=UPI004058E23A
MDISDEWYYKNESNTVVGPLSLSQIRKLALGGSVDWQTPVYTEGLDDWRPLELTGLCRFLPRKPQDHFTDTSLNAWADKEISRSLCIIRPSKLLQDQIPIQLEPIAILVPNASVDASSDFNKTSANSLILKLSSQIRKYYLDWVGVDNRGHFEPLAEYPFEDLFEVDYFPEVYDSVYELPLYHGYIHC